MIRICDGCEMQGNKRDIRQRVLLLSHENVVLLAALDVEYLKAL